MSVRIRLSRIGKKHVPFCRIVAVDSRRKRDGACLADLGTYDVLKSAIVRLDEEGIKYWLSVGAKPSESVKKIVKDFKKAQKPAAPVTKVAKMAKKAKVAKVEKTAEVAEPKAKKEDAQVKKSDS